MAQRVGPGSGEPRVRGLTIGEAAARLAREFPGLRPETLRVMERQGLLEPRRTPSGYRRYAERDLEAVRRILAGAPQQRAEPPRAQPGRAEPPPPRAQP
ncbi:MerR family transcriptional regulator, partial [Actinospica durhamensis]